LRFLKEREVVGLQHDYQLFEPSIRNRQRDVEVDEEVKEEEVDNENDEKEEEVGNLIMNIYVNGI